MKTANVVNTHVFFTYYFSVKVSKNKLVCGFPMPKLIKILFSV